MFLPSTTLFLAMAILPSGGTPKEPVAKGPYELRGQVLDVFGSNQFLLSIGTEQGARHGLRASWFEPARSPRR